MAALPLAAYDPSATPAWRWDLARRLAVDRRRIRREHRSDARLMAAIAHLCERPDDAIDAALALHEAGGVAQWAVEAWLLAGLDDTGIATQTGLPPAVVAAYEPLFYDVRRHLPPGTDWVLRQCVGPAAWRGFRRDEVRQLWAYAAMAAGPLLVDLLVAPVMQAGTTKPTLDVYLQDAGLDLRLKRWIAAKAEPVAGAEPTAVIESLKRLAELAEGESVAAAVGSGVAGLRPRKSADARCMVELAEGGHLERLAAGLRAVASARQDARSESTGSVRTTASARRTPAPRRRTAAVG